MVASGLAVPFADNSFDAVWCSMVLEHVPEPVTALKEICRVLKEDGQVYIIVPQNYPVHYYPHDYFRYTHKGLEYLCQKAGLEVLESVQIGGYRRAMYNLYHVNKIEKMKSCYLKFLLRNTLETFIMCTDDPNTTQDHDHLALLAMPSRQEKKPALGRKSGDL